MNRIYKVIWNKTRGMYMVVSELAKGQSKDGRRAVGRKKVAQTAAALAVFFSIVSMGGTSFAADTTMVEPAGTGSTTAQEVYTKEGADKTFATSDQLQKDVAAANEELAKKANAADVYSKTETDTKLADKANTADVYSKTDADNKFAKSEDLQRDVAAINEELPKKANAADVYTKSEVDNKDQVLNDRISSVKEYLQNETENHYVSKAGLASELEVKDVGVVKADQTIGENVTNLGKALSDETAARIGADAAQDKVIKQVNDNLVASVNTINESVKTTNENMAAGFTALSQTDAAEAAAREAKDTELNERITNEANAIHDEIKAGDTALNDRITNVKEYLEKQTSDNYVSKTDAAVQDGAIVKAANTIGENVTNLDAALAKETAARIGADAAQDKVIQQVNDNLVSSVDAINKNMAAGFNALSQADANELAGRVAADTKLAEAVNGGLSLNDNNVLQKNTTKVNSDGTVSTSKEAATTLVMNAGKENQITLSEKGVKVGLNSTVQDANGFYAGGDTADKAKAALNADGSIKGANGAFTVDENGNVASGNVTSTGTVQGATLTDGTATISNGNIKTNGGFIQTGGGNVNTQGGEVRTNGGKVATSGGEINTGSGNIKTVGGDILTAGGKLNTSGGDIVAGTGNISGQNITASGVLSGDSLTVTKGMTGHSLTLTGGDLDAGAGTIKTTGAVEAGTLTTTGDATIGGNLTVDKNLTVNGEFNAKTLSSKLDENNYTIITGGKTQSVNLKMDPATGETKASASTFDETGSNMWAKDDDSIVKSTVTADGISQKLSDTGDNPTAYAESAMSQGTDNKYTMTDTVKDGDKTNVASQSATESSDVITEGSGDSAKTSTFRQKIDQILQEIKSANGSTSVEQTDVNITNTAKNGTITNEAQTLVNKATGDMTNTVGGKMLNDVTGDMENKVGGNLTTTVGGNETHTVSGTLTETVTGDVTKDYKANLSTAVGGNQTTTVTGDSSLTAENITNEARNKITNKALDVETDASSSIVSKVSNEYGSNTSTQLSYQTTEEMSQADGKTASYLRGAAEEKSQLTDGDKKTTIDTVAGQTNTNITEGTNTSNSLQKADQAASSVTDGTNTTVVNQDATSLASSITDGTKANNTNSTVDKSEQLIKASDTQYSASVKTATASAERLVSGNIIDILKDAENGYVNTTVTSSDGASSTSVKQGTEDITNTAKQGTITNEAKNLVNKAEEIENTATTSIKDVVGKSTVTTTDTGTTFENTDHAAAIGEGSITKTTISGNTLETGKATADYVDVNKDLHVMGNTKLDGTLEVAGKSAFKDDVTMDKNLEVKGTTTTDKLVVNNGANITGGTTTDTLHVTKTATFDGMVTFKEAVSMEKDLSVGGNATVTGDVTAKSYKVGDKTYINQNGINANGQKITNVADGTIAERSTDAVNGGQLNATNQRVTTVENRMDGVENRMDRVENRVDNLDNRIDKVGASAAAMANLHPMDFDEDSKVSVAVAMGSYRSETAGALGVFYRPTDRVMLNVSTSFGNGENMVGGGVSFKLGKSSKRLEKAEATNVALAKQVTNLQNRLDALLGVLNPSLSKDFPDVPANHWAYEAVSRLAGNDIVQGYEDGKYHGERTMTRYEMAEIIYNALSKGAKAEAKLVEEFRPELQAMAAQRKA
ncbi:ESPR-type extended signal peptide-containing protein [uncultured Acidaminococcus sp.]|uniref:ESPR-type extended signal peptide-containing protein n=1 Tax=uncultured Acidaminococcus sp. TaxID=352152 RepID=UPI00265E02FD|nr:ESPR-type extended signal peptide-containing protein [uncultured Acidaminococcus sp.]